VRTTHAIAKGQTYKFSLVPRSCLPQEEVVAVPAPAESEPLAPHHRVEFGLVVVATTAHVAIVFLSSKGSTRRGCSGGGRER
jgi:hypothetical protein